MTGVARNASELVIAGSERMTMMAPHTVSVVASGPANTRSPAISPDHAMSGTPSIHSAAGASTIVATRSCHGPSSSGDRRQRWVRRWMIVMAHDMDASSSNPLPITASVRDQSKPSGLNRTQRPPKAKTSPAALSPDRRSPRIRMASGVTQSGVTKVRIAARPAWACDSPIMVRME